MVRLVGEPVTALSRFGRGRFSPVRVQWRNHLIRVRTVTGRWTQHDGQFFIYHFALVSDSDAFYEVSFHTRDMTWYLDKMAVEA
jgi:hypothetical protein